MAKWLKSTDHLMFSVDGAVATITLNRPEKRNALSRAPVSYTHLDVYKRQGYG